ncbi:hypothetical protein RV07_GL004044 [Enterococcus malodoratus]|nr:hypothetical protein RV07_GL004044 [Enterococcus malodoratus]
MWWSESSVFDSSEGFLAGGFSIFECLMECFSALIENYEIIYWFKLFF